MSFSWTRARNLYWELRLGIRTRTVSRVSTPDSASSSTLPYDFVRAVLDHLDLGAEDIFADVGCGRGRVVCCAAQRPLRRVLGIEFDEEQAHVARENVRRLRFRRSPIEIVSAPAQEFDYRDVSAIYLFNPFGAATMRRWLDRLASTRTRRSPPLRIAYALPRWDELLAERSWLEPSGRWEAGRLGSGAPETAFWRCPGTGVPGAAPAA